MAIRLFFSKLIAVKIAYCCQQTKTHSHSIKWIERTNAHQHCYSKIISSTIPLIKHRPQLFWWIVASIEYSTPHHISTNSIVTFIISFVVVRSQFCLCYAWRTLTMFHQIEFDVQLTFQPMYTLTMRECTLVSAAIV